MKIMGGLFVVPDKPGQPLNGVLTMSCWWDGRWHHYHTTRVPPPAIAAALQLPDDVQ